MKTIKQYQEILCSDIIRDYYMHSYMSQEHSKQFLTNLLRFGFIIESFEAGGLVHELMDLPKGSHVKLTYKIELIDETH